MLRTVLTAKGCFGRQEARQHQAVTALVGLAKQPRGELDRYERLELWVLNEGNKEPLDKTRLCRRF